MILHRTIPAVALLVALSVALSVLAACATSGSRQCAVGADCASGVCRADGTCAPLETDAGPGADADPTAPDAEPGFCEPNHDGVVERAEVPLVAGRTATFRVGTGADVSTAGELMPNGMRSWDLVGPMANDSDVLVELEAVEGQWFADAFPDASYATRISQTEELLGVFQVTDDALLLLGVVSPQAGLGRTELTYDPPVQVLAFPLDTSSSWTVDTTVSGLAAGVGSLYSERYEYQVDAVGELDTPFGTFPVQRVAIDLTRTVGAAVVTVKSFAFVSECYGTVATITSEEYETDDEFDRAAEVRRLAP